MKKYRVVLALALIVVFCAATAHIVCINRQKISNQFWIWLADMSDEHWEIGKKRQEYEGVTYSWSDGTYRIYKEKSGKKLEYYKELDGHEEKITVLNSVITHESDYITGRYYVLAENGYAIVDWQNNVRIYTSEDRASLENVRYLESLEEFTKEEQETFESMKPLFPRVRLR